MAHGCHLTVNKRKTIVPCHKVEIPINLHMHSLFIREKHPTLSNLRHPPAYGVLQVALCDRALCAAISPQSSMMPIPSQSCDSKGFSDIKTFISAISITGGGVYFPSNS